MLARSVGMRLDVAWWVARSRGRARWVDVEGRFDGAVPRAADTRSPVSSSSRACIGPMRARHTTEITAGATPTRTSLNANRADSTATARSHAATNPLPPPATCPCTRATIGLGWSSIASSTATSARGPLAAKLSPSAAAAPARSAPAQNVEPSPVSTITRTPASSLAVRRCSRSPPMLSALSTLRVSGDASVIVATPSVASYVVVIGVPSLRGVREPAA